MKKILLSILLLYPIMSYTQIVEFSDPKFKDALISLGIDGDGDGEISYSECDTIEIIDISNENIYSLDGIEAFVNLIELSCDGNINISHFDVSNNIKLKVLTFIDCRVVYLDASKNQELEYIVGSNNVMERIILKNNSNLTDIYCDNNKLDSLDVSHCTNLSLLRCRNNNIRSLDVTNNLWLGNLSVGNNKLTTLDVSKNTHLLGLDCGGNNIEYLDVTNNTRLYNLECNNSQLKSLDISKNTKLKYLYLSNAPLLNEVCVWEIPFPPSGLQIDTTGSSNVNFITDCSVDINDSYVEGEKINIYPNPVYNEITVNSEEKLLALQLIDSKGSLLKSFRDVNFQVPLQINVQYLNRGIYILKLITDKNILVHKFIKL